MKYDIAIIFLLGCVVTAIMCFGSHNITEVSSIVNKASGIAIGAVPSGAH